MGMKRGRGEEIGSGGDKRWRREERDAERRGGDRGDKREWEMRRGKEEREGEGKRGEEVQNKAEERGGERGDGDERGGEERKREKIWGRGCIKLRRGYRKGRDERREKEGDEMERGEKRRGERGGMRGKGRNEM